MAVVEAEQATDYLAEYVRRYRSEYERFTSSGSEGGGYPRIPLSPYQYGGHLQCYLASDGAVVLDTSRSPPDGWEIAGGPAIMSDFPETRTPQWVTDTLRDADILGEPIGIYRVVSQSGISESVWRGELGRPTEIRMTSVGDVEIEVAGLPYDWSELIRRLSYGALDLILDLHLPSLESEFWNPRIIRRIGFLPADRTNNRFFHYAELLRHVDAAAWEERSAWMRAHVDVRRDFAHAVTRSETGRGGFVSFNAPEVPIGPRFFDRWEALRTAADGLEELLRSSPNADEQVFHDYIRDHSLLLDVYGQSTSKPRLHYPSGKGPTGKAYVEPDFIISYWNETYKLIELENPGHLVATREGHPRAEVTHAAYQIAEWKDFIANHYSKIADRFPGISTGLTSSVIVISRDRERSFNGVADRNRYIGLLRQQFAVDEVLTYDDLIVRAREALRQLQSLADSLGNHPQHGTD